MLLLARSATITKKPYRSTCNKNNVSLQLKARVNANMRLVFYKFDSPNLKAIIPLYCFYANRASVLRLFKVEFNVRIKRLLKGVATETAEAEIRGKWL